jgi:ribonuclease E
VTGSGEQAAAPTPAAATAESAHAELGEDAAIAPDVARPHETAAAATADAPAATTVAEAGAPAGMPRMPRAAHFELPMDELRAIAASAGLEWVNSDAERILVVQQAMANEPKPVHVPRQPRPRVVIDDGPLVLVETRKDLSQLKLPFEQPQA